MSTLFAKIFRPLTSPLLSLWKTQEKCRNIVLPRNLDLDVANKSNTGDAGGVMTSFSLGDLKIAAGRTNGIVGVGQYSKRIVFPSGLFSQAPYFVANISTAHGSVTGNLIIGNNVSKDDASVYWSNTTGNGSVGGVVSWIAIGS